MDLHCEMILQEYKDNLEVYEKIKNIAVESINKIVKDHRMLTNSIEARIKEYNSLKNKLELKGNKYKSIQDITDIVGCRIVTFYNDEVDKIATKIAENFDVDWENSIDKRKTYNIDQFGYMSLHYICRIPKKMFYDEKMPLVNEVRFEVQMRSVLQHTWAVIYHDTGYKSDIEVPSEYLRALNRLAGLLEIADYSFTEIRTSIDNYRRKIKTAFEDGKYQSLELNADTFASYLNTEPFDALNKRIASINSMEIEKVSLRNYLKVFKLFGFSTLKDIDDLIKNYGEFAYQLAVLEFEKTDLDIISSSTGLFLLCIAFILDKDLGLGGVELFLETIYGVRKSNKNIASKFVELGKKVGIGAHK